MSHFTVGVLVDKKGKNLEELLAPYQEVAIGIFGIIDYFRYRMFVYKLERHGKITDCVNDTKSEILIKMLESDIENLRKKIN